MKILTFLAAAVALLSGCSKPAESGLPADQLGELRRQVNHAMLTEATNEVPGIRAIVQTTSSFDAKTIPQWWGTVLLDYANSAGGVSHTNLQMKFGSTRGNLYALPDAEFYQKEYEKHLADLKAGVAK